jgi:hypothetical protein
MHTDEKGNVRVGLDYMMAHPNEFGYALIVPDPRHDAPTQFFRVDKTDMSPDKEFAQLWRDRKHAVGIRGDYGGQVVRGDLLLHQETGMWAAVVQRVSQWNFRIACLIPPQTVDDIKSFLGGEGSMGVGHWAVVGQVFDKNEASAALKDMFGTDRMPQNVTDPKDLREARKDTSKNPDAQGWAEQGKHICKDPRTAMREIRKKNPQLLGAFARFLAGHKSLTAETLMDKVAVKKVATKDGKGSVTFWNTGAAIAQFLKEGRND